MSSSRASASSRSSRACRASWIAAGIEASPTSTTRPFSRSRAPRSRRSRIASPTKYGLPPVRSASSCASSSGSSPSGVRFCERARVLVRKRLQLELQEQRAGSACGRGRRAARRGGRGRCDGRAGRRPRSARPREAARRAARAWPRPTSGDPRAPDRAGALVRARRRAGRASRTSGAGRRRARSRAAAAPAPARAPGRAGWRGRDRPPLPSSASVRASSARSSRRTRASGSETPRPSQPRSSSRTGQYGIVSA